MASTFDSINANYRTEEMLEAWGRWAYEKNKLGTVSVCGIILEMFVGRIINQGSQFFAKISDEEALVINAALGKLMMRSPEAYCLLEAIYRFKWDQANIARKTGLKRHVVKSAHDWAVGFVDAELFRSCSGLVT